MKTIKQAKICYIAVAVLFCLAGLWFILAPRTAANTVCMCIGILCMVYGAARIVGYLSRDIYHLAFQFDLALGILCIAFGFALVLRPERISSVLPALVGLFVLCDGVFRVQTAFDAKAFGLGGWWGILCGALLCIGLGGVLFFNAVFGGTMFMVILGVALLADGVQNLFNVLYTVKTGR